MKPLLTFSLILLSLSSYSQTAMERVTGLTEWSKDTIPATKASNVRPNYYFYEQKNNNQVFRVMDSVGRIVAYQKQDSAIVIIDTLATIRVLIETGIMGGRIKVRFPERKNLK